MGHRLLPLSPARYHGKPSSRPYFEGWYFKQVSEEFAFVAIPGVFHASDPSEDIAFIQLIYGSPLKSDYLTYPISEFDCHPKRFELCIGGSTFSEKEMQLDVPQIGIKAKLQYSHHIPLKMNIVSPTIMGPFSYLPKMQCNHGILSLWHRVCGEVQSQDQKIVFDNADGYIEKDWGEAFPESWVWMQCGSNREALMCAIARIPMIGCHFTGLIGVLNTGDKQYRFATYNGGRILEISRREGSLTLELKRGRMKLCIIAQNTRFGTLKAPSKTGMDREIQESVDCVYDISLCHDVRTVYSGHFEHGGLEMLKPELLLKKKYSHHDIHMH